MIRSAAATMRGLERDTVFSSPDPAEAERVRELLDEAGLGPELYSGPDPVTGVGGHLFGGAGGHMFLVEVPAARAEAARAILEERAGSVEGPPRPGAAPAPPRLRRVEWTVVGAFVLAGGLLVVLATLEGMGRTGSRIGFVLAGVCAAAGIVYVLRGGGDP